MLSHLLLWIGTTTSASAADARPERWLVDSHVVLPSAAVIGGIDGTGGGRIGAWTVQLVLDCDVLGIQRDCRVEQAALSVVPYRTDPVVLAPHVERLGAALVGATVRLEQRHDGRISSWEVYGLDHPERSFQERDSLGAVLQRAVVGFELAAPRLLEVQPEHLAPWSLRDPLLSRLPSLDASQGRVDLEYRPGAVEDGVLTVSVGGRGTVRAAGEATNLAARIVGLVQLDGYRFEQVTWWAESVPLGHVGPGLIDLRLGGTTSYARGEMATGQPLVQGGQLRRLAPGEAVVLTATDPTAPPAGSPGRTLVADGPDDLDGWMMGGDAERLVRSPPPRLTAAFGGRLFGERQPTGTASVGLDLQVATGVRSSVGLRAELPTGLDPEQTAVRSSQQDLLLRAGFAWAPPWRIAPWLGAALGGGVRHLDEGTPAWLPAVAVGPELGLQWQATERTGLFLRGSVEHDLLRVLAVRPDGREHRVDPWSTSAALGATWSTK